MPSREKSASYRHQLAQMCRMLFSSPVVQRRAPALATGAQQFLQLLRANQDCRTSFRLQLEPNWRVGLAGRDICGAPGRTELHFGGEIVFDDECLYRQVLTVVVLFCADEPSTALPGRPNLIAGESHVVRRFHFDFDRGAAGLGTPLAHLQFGGHLNQDYLTIPDTRPCRYELFDQLDYPRLPWTINDLPIVLDLFLRQFPAGLDQLIHGSAWRQLVMVSEQIWLKDFFRQAFEMMNVENGRECFYDFCCEESAYD